MRMSLISRKSLKRLGLAGLVLFALKGLAWLLLGGILFFEGCS